LSKKERGLEMNVNIIFDYPSKGFGTHTAFMNHIKSIQARNLDFSVNKILSKDISHAHTLGPLSVLNATRGKNFIFTYHMTRYESTFLKLQGGFIRKILGYVLKKSSAIVAPSPFCKQEIATKKPTAVISNGVDSRYFRKSRKRRAEFREKHGIEKDEILVYNIGMLISKKGVLDFGKIAELYKDDFRFLWVGRSYPHVKCMSIDYLRKKFPSVIFAGFVKDIRDVHSAGDLLLYTSVHEILGIPVLEACSAGNPCIIRDIPTFAGWMKHGKDCLKFDNADSITPNIEELQCNALKHRIVMNGRKIAEKHDISELGKYYEKLYELCADGKLSEADYINSYI
jgi:1,2-diacylglycerol-3-alpha-glucose alpha-1,2-glucosyltransferase